MSADTGIARLILLMTIFTMAAACTSMGRYRDQDPDPNHRLDRLLNTYEEATSNGQACLELWRVDSATVDCNRILREVERLYAEYPNNPRILMGNAILNFEAGRHEKAQFLLDELLAQYGAHPEAGILRSRIALSEGNSRLARDVLERQIALSPDRADLREALAAAYYVAGSYDTARVVLGIAGRLGAPGWRLSYHHGLLCEAELNWNEACRFYGTALDQKADYMPAQSRLIGLSQHKECRDQPALSGKPPGAPINVASIPPVSNAVDETPDAQAGDDTPRVDVVTRPYVGPGGSR